ncbi:MAG: hypothetical protein C5B47_03680 [Verrucomicrobia bacterium]|nr:MAG: hypothetical protein C5B47_03680 [Verrucomicrobiota bacterium]
MARQRRHAPKVKNNKKFKTDKCDLCYFLRRILANHSEIEESGNSDEKEHYALIKKIARDKKLFVYSDLKTELEKMSNFFPKWGKQEPPPQTQCDDVAKL